MSRHEFVITLQAHFHRRGNLNAVHGGYLISCFALRNRVVDVFLPNLCCALWRMEWMLLSRYFKNTHQWNILTNFELHQACIEVAYDNIQRCPPNTDGRAFDSGCFMRFSDRPFFADNQTINLKPFLKTTETPSQPTFVILMHFQVSLAN